MFLDLSPSATIVTVDILRKLNHKFIHAITVWLETTRVKGEECINNRLEQRPTNFSQNSSDHTLRHMEVCSLVWKLNLTWSYRGQTERFEQQQLSYQRSFNECLLAIHQTKMFNVTTQRSPEPALPHWFTELFRIFQLIIISSAGIWALIKTRHTTWPGPTNRQYMLVIS